MGTKKEEKRRVIVVSLPGAVQESIHASLEAIPSVEVIGFAGGGLSAIALVEEKQPDIAIIDGNLAEDEVLAFLRDVRHIDTRVRIVVLTNSMRQQRLITGNGADAVLSRWCPPEQLTSTVLGTD